MSNTANNYAFEIRFVDDNIVQVFDIAAKRQHQDINNFLPTEYKQDEVLKGQLRYSKLVGSAPSTHQKDTFGLEEDGQPYKHIVTTKRSENRRSTQRHTFFMMGGGGGSGSNSNHMSTEDITDMAYDSGTAISEEETMELSSHLTCNQDEKQIDINNHWVSEIDSTRSSNSHAVSPGILESPTPVLSPPLTPPTNHHQEKEPETMITGPLSPQLPKEPEQILVKPRTSLKSPYRNTHNNDYIPYKENNHYTIATLTEQQSVIHSPLSVQKTVESIPHVTIQQETLQPANSYSEDYTSLSVVETNGHDSRQNMNQDHVEKAPKRGCCCIIS